LTVLSYRDAIKLLLRFTSKQKRRPIVRMQIEDFDASDVRAFLDHLEQQRRNQIVTRNNRLAAIRSFFTFVAAEEPAVAEQCRRICAIPFKRAAIRAVPYLAEDEMTALLNAPDQTTVSGRRDRALLLFLYNTGARVQELTKLRVGDLQLSRPAHALLHGKGKKDRICPLWPETARSLHRLLDDNGIALADSDRQPFMNGHGQPLTRFGVDYIVKKYVAAVGERLPALRRKRVSPHVLRHTTAVHMLNSGVDLNVVRSWLGHVDIRTTSIYAEIDLSTKRKAIESCAPSFTKRTPSWKRKPDLLAWLEAL
jgi:site-specific recombinase XerD